jgi:hypothetical protein
MKDSKKKRIKVVIIATCLSAPLIAIAYLMSIAYIERVRFIRDAREWNNVKVCLLCRRCQHSWQMRKRDYFEYMLEHQDPNSWFPPEVFCPNCRENGGWKAKKCGKCGFIFQIGDGVHDFPDRCPNCRYSYIEEHIGIIDRKAEQKE